MAGQRRRSTGSARSAPVDEGAQEGAAARGGVAQDLPTSAVRSTDPALPGEPPSEPSAEPSGPPARVTVPESHVVYVSVADAARRTGASLSSVRLWLRDGKVRSRTGTGPRGERVEVAVADVEMLRSAEPAAPGPGPAPARRSARRRADVGVTVRRDEAPGGQLVPLSAVEAMERLAGELYLSGQRAARAEAVAELRENRLADLQQEVEDLQREATGLWEQNQELLRRVAVAEAQVQAAPAQQGGSGRWWGRR